MAACESFAPLTMPMSIQVQSDNIHSSVKVHDPAWTDLATLSSKEKWKPKTHSHGSKTWPQWFKTTCPVSLPKRIYFMPVGIP